MSSKHLLLIVCISAIVLLLAVISYMFIPHISLTLNGEKRLVININGIYEEKGAKAKVKSSFIEKELPVIISGDVDTSKFGKYEIGYEASYFWFKKTDTRLVEVRDIEKPKITLKDKVKYCQKNKLIEINATATDNVDGDISDKIQYKVDKNKAYLQVSDSSNNIEEIEADLKIIDNEKPIITLKGQKEINMFVGERYTESGVSAYDSCDGNLSNKVTISGSVDTNNIGKYEITYSVKDSSNNVSEVKRTVNVSSATEGVPSVPNTTDISVNGGYIYLTFDDGPGPYTQDILNTLDKYNVKATFFVTNQFPKYQSLIKTEYQKGHTVGIHTYTHKWSVYESVDTYLDDFNKINEVIKTQTGTNPKFFRFPGGSSNTISYKYCKGIMTQLSQLMESKGYVYFDWTFDSGDTSKKNNSKEDIIRNFKNGLKGNGHYIVLMHDINKNTMIALPTVIEYGLSKGYKFRPITDSTPVKHSKIAN